MEHFGLLSLIPPLLAIFLAWKSREVLISLFIGIYVGVLILNNWNPFIAFFRTLDQYIVGSVADSWNAAILIFLLTLGGMVGIINRSGATNAVANFITRRASTAKSAQMAAFWMGILIFFDDYANSLIVGTTMRSITDRMKISREKLSYIVDCTAAPVASMALISTWIGYEMGLIQKAFDKLGLAQNVYTTFLQTIPFRFYSLFALVFLFLIIYLGRDFGPMYRAEIRARKTGKVYRDGSSPLVSKEFEEMVLPDTPLNWYHAFLPIITVLVVTMIGLWYNGGGLTGIGIQKAFSDADASVVLLWASFAGTIVAGLTALIKRVLSLNEIMEAWMSGVKSLAVAGGILILAWSLGDVIEALGTANYLIGLADGVIPVFLVPTMMFLLASFVAFATGTSWGTNAIMMPLAIPLAVTLGAPLIPTIGSVLTGCVFGDHCSPISDTTIMSSTASGSDHMDHVQTQLPYVLSTGIIAILVGFIPVGLGVPFWVILPVGSLIIFGVIRKFGRQVESI
ncbi:MAG: Na+/H+ antiporter NhaC family protein [Halanaerobiales bacterium]|nr:Na+/H+ antiporter NhaC family protein [Halanaerobiales bacterium]